MDTEYIEKAVIDTSSLLYMASLKKNLLGNISSIVIAEAVIDELEKKAKKSNKYKSAKALIFKILSQYNIIVEPLKGYADEAILSLAEKYDVFIVNDRELKRKLLEKGVKVYSIGRKSIR